MRSRVCAAFAVLSTCSPGLVAAEHIAGVPVSSLTHIHGIAFGAANDLIVATHHGVFTVDPAGRVLISAEK